MPSRNNTDGDYYYKGQSHGQTFFTYWDYNMPLPRSIIQVPAEQSEPARERVSAPLDPLEPVAFESAWAATVYPRFTWADGEEPSEDEMEDGTEYWTLDDDEDDDWKHWG